MKNLKVLLSIAITVFTMKGQCLTFDKDVTPELQKQMTEDLAFMAQIKGEKQSPLHEKIFGKMDGDSYKNFFETRITSVGLSDCGSPKAVACVIPFYDPNKMWITNNFIKFSHPQIARSMVVYHEARHSESENGNWMHATCPTPFVDENGNELKSIWTGATLAGEPACDDTALGSYGSSTILLHNVAVNCSNCTDKVKMDAKIYSDDQTNRLIDQAKADVKKDFGSI
jgi:hypothetical protein